MDEIIKDLDKLNNQYVISSDMDNVVSNINKALTKITKHHKKVPPSCTIYNHYLI